MKKITATLRKNKQEICAIAFVILFFLFIGVTGTADLGGSIIAYLIKTITILTMMVGIVSVGRN